MTRATPEFAPWLGVFETLRVVDGAPLFMPEHLLELGRAMDALGLNTEFDFARARRELPRLSGRWRWIVNREETRTLFTEEEPPPPGPVALSISPVRVGSGNWDARFKTLSSLPRFQAWKTATTGEVVLLNEHGQVASASRGNIFWRQGDRVYTPAHEAGCRRGVVREFVLKQREVETGHFPAERLLEAEEIFVTGSIRGIVSVGPVEGRELETTSCAEQMRLGYVQAVAAQLRP